MTAKTVRPIAIFICCYCSMPFLLREPERFLLLPGSPSPHEPTMSKGVILYPLRAPLGVKLAVLPVPEPRTFRMLGICALTEPVSVAPTSMDVAIAVALRVIDHDCRSLMQARTASTRFINVRARLSRASYSS